MIDHMDAQEAAGAFEDEETGEARKRAQLLHSEAQKTLAE